MDDKIEQSANFIAKRKAQILRHLMPLAILGLGTVSFLIIILFSYLSKKQGHIYSYNSLIMSVEISTANSHLWLEEYVTGDSTIDIEKNLAAIDQSIEVIGGLLNDGISWHGVMLQPLDDRELIARVEVVEALLKEFKSTAIERLAQPEHSGIGSVLDQRFDEIYERLVGEIMLVQRVFDVETIAIREQSQRFFFGILFLWTAIISWSVVNIVKLESFRRRAEEALRASLEHRFTNILDTSGEAIISIDAEQRIIVFNKRASEIFGYRADEVMGKSLDILLPLDFVESHRTHIEEFTASTATARLMNERAPVSGRRRDGTTFPAEASISKVSVAGETILTVILRDITKRKLAEDKIITEKLYHEALLENAPEAIAVLDNGGNVTDINEEYSRLFGYTLEDTKGRHINDLIIPPNLEDEGISYSKDVQSDKRMYAETKRMHKDGSFIDVSLLGAPILNAKGDQIGSYAIYRDLTEPRNIQRLLSNKEKRLESILETAVNPIITIDVKGNIESFNTSATKIFGYSEKEVIGKNVNILMEEPEKSEHDGYIEKYIKTGESNIIGISREVTGRRKNGEQFPAELFINRVDLEGEVIFVGLLIDITKRKKNQAERERLTLNLERAHRMESLGILAGGVAHDLNNIIGPIVAYPDLILMDLPPDTSVKSDILAIKSAAERAADIISDLLSLARRGKYDMTPQNLNDVVHSFIKSPEFKEAQSRRANVVNRLELAEDLYNINSSSTHLYKVILNLVNNAFDSMEDGGILSIRTFNEQVEKKTLVYEEIQGGLYVVLEVEDQGTGISDEDIRLIFDPFFSTKKKVGRRGSGLGLSVVHGIVKDHKGYVDVESHIGKGTKIRIYFPATKDQEIITTELKKDYSGSETILTVDDDIEQLKIIDKLLSSLGYKVITAENGREAVEQIKKEKVDLIMLDMIMEDDFSGLDTYREILKLYPNQKAIIVSGYSETEQVRETLNLGAGSYIKKPYDIDTIGKTVREELDKNGS